MKTIATVPLLVLALTACEPYNYGQGPQPYPQGPQGYPEPYPGYPQPGYPQGGPPMPPGGPVYPGPGQPVPAPGYPAPSYPAPGNATDATSYRAIGTEPFWDLEIGRDLIFTDRGNNVSVSDPTPTPINGVAGETYRTQRLEVNIVHRQCSDGMSDRSYPDTVDVRVDGRQRYRGCGAPIAYFEQTNESGQATYPAQPAYPAQPTYPSQPNYPSQSNYPPQPAYPGYPGPGNYPGQPGYGGAGNYPAPGSPGAMMLSGTNWRVTAINGRPTQPRNFYMNFMPDGSIGAKFGCNSLGGGYSQQGPTLTTTRVIGTQMACGDMSFESQGAKILAKPMTASGFGNHLTLTNTNGTIDLVRAN